jgi:hypothetical protein
MKKSIVPGQYNLQGSLDESQFCKSADDRMARRQFFFRAGAPPVHG